MERSTRLRRWQILRSPDRVWGIAVPVVFAIVLAYLVRTLWIFLTLTPGPVSMGEVFVAPAVPMTLRTVTIVTTLAVAAYALLWTLFAAVDLVRAGRPVLRVDLGRLIACLLFLLLAGIAAQAALRLPTAADVVAAARAATLDRYPGPVARAVRDRIPGTDDLCLELRNGGDPALAFLGAAGLWRLGDRSEETLSVIHENVERLRTDPPPTKPWTRVNRILFEAQDLLIHPGPELGIERGDFNPRGAFWDWWATAEPDFR